MRKLGFWMFRVGGYLQQRNLGSGKSRKTGAVGTLVPGHCTIFCGERAERQVHGQSRPGGISVQSIERERGSR